MPKSRKQYKIEPWRKQLMEDNVKLAYYVVNKYGQFKDDEEFATAEEALVRAALVFDPNKGTKFTTYASRCIRFRLIQLNSGGRHMISARSNGKWRYLPVDSFEQPLPFTDKGGDRGVTIGECLEETEGMNEAYIVESIALRDWFNNLSKRDKQILQLRMNGVDQKKIAQIVGLSQAYVSRLITKLKKQYLKEDY